MTAKQYILPGPLDCVFEPVGGESSAWTDRVDDPSAEECDLEPEVRAMIADANAIDSGTHGRCDGVMVRGPDQGFRY